jgi:hypothetical protein
VRRLGALLVAAAFAAGLAFLVNGPWLRVSSIAWAGSRYVAADDLAPILDPLKGTSLFLVDARVVAGEVAVLPGVEGATIEPRFPDGLSVQLTERSPAVVWQTSVSRLLVDADGTVVGELVRSKPLPGDLARLPLVDDGRTASLSIRRGDHIPDAELAMALRLTSLDPKLLGSKATALKVAIDEGCGYVVTPRGAGRWSAALGYHALASGTPDDSPPIEAQVAAVRTLFSTHRESTVAWVDARNPGKVYWRPTGSGSNAC